MDYLRIFMDITGLFEDAQIMTSFQPKLSQKSRSCILIQAINSIASGDQLRHMAGQNTMVKTTKI